MKTYRLTILVLAIAILLFMALPNLSWAAEDGAALYKANCAMCHGPDAAGKPAMKAPAVKGKTEADIKKAFENPKHAAAKKKTNDEQVKAIADYLQTLK
jgi:mono/diheme cytochrome c family protein